MENFDAGIDYGRGISNRDPKNPEMHYGVISANKLGEWAYENFEADYGNPTCPECGNEVRDYDAIFNEVTEEQQEAMNKWECDGCVDYVCLDCEKVYDSQDAFPEEPISHTCNEETLIAELDSSNDVWILKSEYYTLCAYCSPCAPGAGYLTNVRENGIKAYCLPQDWFDKDNPCPYPIYRVADDTLVYTPSQEEE